MTTISGVKDTQQEPSPLAAADDRAAVLAARRLRRQKHKRMRSDGGGPGSALPRRPKAAEAEMGARVQALLQKMHAVSVRLCPASTLYTVS